MATIVDQTGARRAQESFSSLISPLEGELPPHARALAMAPCDKGVQRNGGRIGARFAPEALLFQLGKLAKPAEFSHPLYWKMVSSLADEAKDFIAAQSQQEEALGHLMTPSTPLIHIGGGHDHVLPLLRAAGRQAPLVVINIDAHCDTRLDSDPHSGNPFRLYDLHTQAPWHLFQIGIHPFANSASTLSPLKYGHMHLLTRGECEDQALLEAFLTSIEASCTPETRMLFSFDCDAIGADEMPAVSAPNPNGLRVRFVQQLLWWYRDFCQQRGQAGIYGVYEFNPLYDDVSGRAARSIAALLYEMVL